MQHDFDLPIPRRHSNCVKWDSPEAANALPMWVADMDFRVAQPIIDALHRRVEHGVFGYTIVPDEYYEAVISWFARRHHWHIEREWMLYTSGVVPALSATIKALAAPGEKVLIQTPVYNCFFSSIRNNGCIIVENPLIPEDGTYHIDFDDLERKAADPQTKLLVFCNPHNPVGRVWTAEEMERVNTICLRNGVKVVTDEIHCEVVMPGYKYTPFASVSAECLDNSITLNSPSKSFNIASLQIANIISNNAETLQRIDRAININEICDVNPFGVVGTIAAYNECEYWIEQLCPYLNTNYEMLRSTIEQSLPKLKLTRLEGTYLAWIDIRGLNLSSDEVKNLLLEQALVLVNSGTMYGDTAGEGYIRLNLACPHHYLQEALSNICKTLSQKS